MKKLRGKLTYANVVSTLCLFLLVGGASAFAAGQLAKEQRRHQAAEEERRHGGENQERGGDRSEDQPVLSRDGAKRDPCDERRHRQNGGAERERRRGPHRHLSEPDDRRWQGQSAMVAANAIGASALGTITERSAERREHHQRHLRHCERSQVPRGRQFLSGGGTTG